MDIRLITMDMDGTLVGKMMQVPHRTRQALQSAMDSGCRVAIATGRSFTPTCFVAQDLDLNAPLILCQGALIQDHRDGTIIHREAIPIDIARDVARFSRERGLAMQAHFEDDRVFTDETNRLIDHMSSITGIQVTKIRNLETWLDRSPLKFLFYEEVDTIDGLVQQLDSEFGSSLTVIRSWPFLVEITASGASKGNALSYLAEYFGVPQAATMAVGDQDNDASMLSWAGLGVAMSNASQAARDAADVVAPFSVSEDTLDNHDEGVAWAIESYVLGG
jgi:Cof subfamily protein (haloacid dehalogenase superfamily)